MDDPVSIRTNNPGAQWLGPVAKAYGASSSIGLPGGNNAASFSDPESGAAAQFALLNNGYANMPLSAAISKWSGGNSSPAYAQFVAKQTGLSPDTVLTPALLQGPQGLALAKAQAHWEAGRPYPLSDAQWASAQSRALGAQGASGPAGMASGASPQAAPLGSGQAPTSLPLFAGAMPNPSPVQVSGPAPSSFFASLPASAAQSPPPSFAGVDAARPPVDLRPLLAFLASQRQPLPGV